MVQTVSNSMGSQVVVRAVSGHHEWEISMVHLVKEELFESAAGYAALNGYILNH